MLKDPSPKFDPGENEEQKKILDKLRFKKGSEKERELVGTDYQLYEYCNGKNHELLLDKNGEGKEPKGENPKLKLYITEKDFASAVYIEEYSTGKNSLNTALIEKILKKRNEFHKEIINSEHGEGETGEGAKNVSEIINELFSKELKVNAEYVFSYFILSYKNDFNDSLSLNWFCTEQTNSRFANIQKCILALAAPSLFNPDIFKTPVKVFKPKLENFSKVIKDIDPRINVCCLASWSSLVILASEKLIDGEKPIDKSEKVADCYEPLEVGIQLSWSTAVYIKKSCKNALENPDTLGKNIRDEQRKNLPLLRTYIAKTSAAISGSDAEIMKGLVEASQLKDEIEAAKESYSYLDIRERDQETKSLQKIAIQVAIVVTSISLLHLLIQVFYEIPFIWDLSLYFLFLILGLPILAFVGTYFLLKRQIEKK